MFKKISQEDRLKMRTQNVEDLYRKRIAECEKNGDSNPDINKEQLAELVDMELTLHECVIPGTNIDYRNYLEDICDLKKEIALLLLLDEKREIIDVVCVSVGDEEHFQLDLKKVAQALVKNPKVKYFIFAHNHPKYYGQDFSLPDLCVTFRMARLGEQLKIFMLDSVVVSEFDFVSLIQKGDNYQGMPIINFNWNNRVDYEWVTRMPVTVKQFLMQFEVYRENELNLRRDYTVWEGDNFTKWKGITDILLREKNDREKIVEYLKNKKL